MRTKAASYLAALLVAACGGDDAPPAPPELVVQDVFPALLFREPLLALQAPGDRTRWFVVEQGGRVRVFASNSQVTAFSTFIDISDRVVALSEMGLLGMAFHPQFPAVPRVFLSYTNESAGRVNRVSEFRLGADGNLDPASERIVLSVPQPGTDHNGGNIAFGPDGFLYIGRGDGSNSANSQSTTTLLGKMLRIDVSPAVGYAIPPDNPFAANPQCGGTGSGALSCPEIFAWGFRNPWRWSFDRATGQLWLADVGAATREEVNRVNAGGNYGWPCFEGTTTLVTPCPTPVASLLPPVAEYGRTEGRSITGGYVYRGSAIAGLAGRYLFGDFLSGRLWHIPVSTQPTLLMTSGTDTGRFISSFAEDVDGEVYIVDYAGKLYRIAAR